MKKIIGLLVVIGLYTAAAFYTGAQGEKQLRLQLALSEEQSAAQGFTLTLDRYQRGIFFSEMDFTVTTAAADYPIPFGPITASSKTRIQHGPVLFFGRFGVGLFSAKSTVNIATGNAEIDAGIQSLFGESIGEIVTIGHFTDSYRATWTLGPIDISDEGKSFTLGESSFDINGQYSNLSSSGTFHIGAWSLAADGGQRVQASPMTGDLSVDNVTPQINIVNFNGVMDTLSIVNGPAVNIAVEKLQVAQKQAVVNGRINSEVNFAITKVQGPVDITNLRYDVAFNQIDMAAMEKWNLFYQKLQASAMQDALESHREALVELLESLLQEGLELKLVMGAELMGGSFLLDWTTGYQPLANGRQVRDIQNPAEYLLLVNSTATLRVSETIVNQTPLVMMMDQYMDTYVTREGSDYFVRGQLKDGELSVGTIVMPAEMLLALLPAGLFDQ